MQGRSPSCPHLWQDGLGHLCASTGQIGLATWALRRGHTGWGGGGTQRRSHPVAEPQEGTRHPGDKGGGAVGGGSLGQTVERKAEGGKEGWGPQIPGCFPGGPNKLRHRNRDCHPHRALARATGSRQSAPRARARRPHVQPGVGVALLWPRVTAEKPRHREFRSN